MISESVVPDNQSKKSDDKGTQSTGGDVTENASIAVRRINFGIEDREYVSAKIIF